MSTTVLQEPTAKHKAFEAFIKTDFAKSVNPCVGTIIIDAETLQELVYRAFSSGAHFKESRIAELEKNDAQPLCYIADVTTICDNVKKFEVVHKSIIGAFPVFARPL